MPKFLLNNFFVPPAERRKTALLFLYFFLVIAAFWILKPVRTSQFIKNIGVEVLPLVRFGTALLVLPCAWAFSAFSRRFSRAALVTAFAGVFGAASLAFGWLFPAGAEQAHPSLHFLMFFYVDVFNTAMVALFWAVANDASAPAESRRTYGWIGLGGILGGAAGSALTGWGIGRLGGSLLFTLSAVLTLLVIPIGRALPDRRRVEDAEPAADAASGARRVFHSRYLLSIAGIVACYEIVSVLIDYQFNALADANYGSVSGLAGFLGKFSTMTILLSGVVQVFATNTLLRLRGPRAGLLVLPVLMLAGSAAFWIAPSLNVIAFAFACDAIFHYSMDQSSKESLYTALGRRARFQSKAFIDMFLFRAAKGAGAAIVLAVNVLLSTPPVQVLSWVTAPVALAWILCSRYAGRRFVESERRADSSAARKRWEPVAS